MSNEEAELDPTVAAPEARDELPEPTVTHTEMEVALQRTVRIGPIMIGAAVLGAVVAAVAALFFPISEEAEYTMGQVVGFVAVLGATIGLALGAVLSLILVGVARRHRGAAIAVLTDVR